MVDVIQPDDWGDFLVTAAETSEKDKLLTRDEKWPPGFQMGRTLHVELLNPNNVMESLYDAEGAVRMRTCAMGAKWHYSGPKGKEFLSRVVSAKFGLVCYWMPVRGELREVRRDLTDAGWRCFFTDYRGDNRWCKVRCVHKSGREVYYEGEWRKKWLRMVIAPNRNVIYFAGAGADLHKVRTYLPPSEFGGVDALLHYDTRDDGSGRRALRLARAVRMEFSDGRLRTLEGEAGRERIAKTTYPSGVFQEFEGARGEEFIVRQINPDGMTVHYVGAKGEERVHRVNHPGGHISLFTGEKGSEHLHAAICFMEGRGSEGMCSLTTYEGEKGEELRKRKLNTRTGIVQVFTGGDPGLQNNEECNRTLRRDGRLQSREHGLENWIVHEETALSVPAIKRQRVKEKAQALWAELETLSEGPNVREQALIEMGVHFKALQTAVDECVA
jgi:hypothetical protein